MPQARSVEARTYIGTTYLTEVSDRPYLGYSPELNSVLRGAELIARQHNKKVLGTIHLLIALINYNKEARHILNSSTPKDGELERFLPDPSGFNRPKTPLTESTERIVWTKKVLRLVECAKIEAELSKSRYTGVKHLMLALCGQRVTKKILETLGADFEYIQRETSLLDC